MANNNADCTDDKAAIKVEPITQGEIVHNEHNIAIIQNLVGAGDDGMWGDDTSLKVGQYIRDAKERLSYSDNNADITPKFIETLKQDGVPAEVITALSEIKENGVLDQSYNRSLSAPTDDGECSIPNEYSAVAPEIEQTDVPPIVDAELTNLYQEMKDINEYLGDKYDYSKLVVPEDDFLTQEEVNNQLDISPEDQKIIKDVTAKLSAQNDDVQKNMLDNLVQEYVDETNTPSDNKVSATDSVTVSEKAPDESAAVTSVDGMAAEMLKDQGINVGDPNEATKSEPTTLIDIQGVSGDNLNTAINLSHNDTDHWLDSANNFLDSLDIPDCASCFKNAAEGIENIFSQETPAPDITLVAQQEITSPNMG